MLFLRVDVSLVHLHGLTLSSRHKYEEMGAGDPGENWGYGHTSHV